MKTAKLASFLSENMDVIQKRIFNIAIDICDKSDELNLNSIEPMAIYAFSTDAPTKGMMRATLRSLTQYDKPDFEALVLCRALKTSGISKNPDTLIQTLNNQSKSLGCHTGSRGLSGKDLSILGHYYNESRIIKLLWNTPLDSIVDTLNMMKTIKERHPTLEYLEKKAKSIEQIHNLCVRALPKVGIENYSLEQREDILLLEDVKLDDDFTIKVPKTHFDLVDLGESLNFCIGNGYYSKEVLNKKNSIIAIFDKSGPKFGVQFTRYNILQAHGLSNDRKFSPPKELLRKLKLIVNKPPVIPSDFIAITDSSVLKGYKYTGKDLYLLLNETIYLYFDVPRDLYEELLKSERKGTFLNKEIKTRNFAYEKVGVIGINGTINN